MTKYILSNSFSVAVVIPSYKVTNHILDVIQGIGDFVSKIYVVDDCCPHNSGEYVLNNCQDSRVIVIHNKENLGVGGAVMAGYLAAINDDIDIVVKVDGDGQMDPSLIPYFIEPIISGDADYTKGNRFFDLEKIHDMPMVRLLGNAALSFMAKMSTGYWNLFDPTNGYTAIHTDVLKRLNFNKVSRRYFFETDMLFRLNLLKAVVVDIPMAAKYSDEVSNLKISNIFFEFFTKHVRNASKRVFYDYYLRGMSPASFELPFGLSLFIFGLFFGLYNWYLSSSASMLTPVGTIMISVVTLLVGLQFLLAFLAYDVSQTPSRSIHLRKYGRELGSKK